MQRNRRRSSEINSAERLALAPRPTNHRLKSCLKHPNNQQPAILLGFLWSQSARKSISTKTGTTSHSRRNCLSRGWKNQDTYAPRRRDSSGVLLLSPTSMWTHRLSPPLRSKIKRPNHMENQTHAAPPVVVSRLVRPSIVRQPLLWEVTTGSNCGRSILCTTQQVHPWTSDCYALF